MAHGHNALARDPASEHMASPHDVALLLADLVPAVAHMAPPRQGR